MGNFTLGRYLPLDSPIHKMDPRAKIIAMLVMLIAVFIPAGWIGYGVIFGVAAITILISKLSFGFIWKSMKPMLMMLFFLLIINAFVMKTGEPLLTLGSFVIYSGAVFQTLYIAIRLMLMIMITTCLTATTKPLDMTLGIEDLLMPLKRFHVPAHEIAMLISLQRAEDLANAMEARGYAPGEKRTRYKVLKMEKRDCLLLLGAFTTLIVMIGLAILL